MTARTCGRPIPAGRRACGQRMDRRSLRRVQGEARTGESRNLLLTTVEGIGLGALGIGLPDIVLFVGMLLKGIYETALRYGFSYDTPEERLWILKAMEASLTKGSGWLERNQAVDQIMAGSVVPDQEALKRRGTEPPKPLPWICCC